MCPRFNGPPDADGPQDFPTNPDGSKPVKPLVTDLTTPLARIVHEEYLMDFADPAKVNEPADGTFVPALHLLPANQRALWPSLRPLRDHGFVLYGGTAICLRLGHRVSVDFAFFSDLPFDHSALIAALPFHARSKVIQEEPNTLTLWVAPADGVGEGVKVSFFGGLTIGRVGHPEVTRDGVVVAASLLDLLGTKLKVMQQRAEKKDYLDIHALLERGVHLDEGLAAGKSLYGRTFQPSEALKALAYFADGNLRELPVSVREALIAASSSVRSVPALTALSSSLGVGEV